MSCMKKDVFKEIDSLQDEINSYRPLSPELVKQLKEYYKIGLTYSSNALEGNTLTESETKIVLEEVITIGGKPLKDHLEAIGHAEAAATNPVKAAALAHKEFVFIHPFIDGNGRTTRLLMNLILLQEGYNIAITPPITRREYIDSLELAHTNDEEFIYFIARMVRETQKDYLRLFLK